ncbi:MAG: hypothetical protein ABEI86_05070, partial [Halobacteriaceae archaeon]
ITGLSWGGIPASLAITATTCVIGLGWGRASRQVTLAESFDPRQDEQLTGDMGDDQPRVTDLYSPDINKRIISAWFATPTVAGVLAYVVFEIALRLNLM